MLLTEAGFPSIPSSAARAPWHEERTRGRRVAAGTLLRGDPARARRRPVDRGRLLLAVGAHVAARPSATPRTRCVGKPASFTLARWYAYWRPRLTAGGRRSVRDDLEARPGARCPAEASARPSSTSRARAQIARSTRSGGTSPATVKRRSTAQDAASGRLGARSASRCARSAASDRARPPLQDHHHVDGHAAGEAEGEGLDRASARRPAGSPSRSRRRRTRPRKRRSPCHSRSRTSGVGGAGRTSRPRVSPATPTVSCSSSALDAGARACAASRPAPRRASACRRR